jgi:hypothetical protein
MRVAAHPAVMAAVWLPIIAFSLSACAGNGAEYMVLPYKLLGQNGEVESHELVMPSVEEASNSVVETCKMHMLRAPGCRTIFDKAVDQFVRMNMVVSGNDIIKMYSTFAALYTKYALEADMVPAVSPELNEFDSPYNYYTVDASVLSESRLGLCVSHYREDLNWLRTIRTPFIIVTKNQEPRFQNKAVQIEKNRGNEVSSYLRYIADYYDALPEFTLFLHGHNEDWHQYYNVFYIIEHLDYQQDFQSVNNVVVFPYDDKPDARLKALWPTLFEDEMGPFPEVGFKAKCCAQFVVHRERIRLRSRAFYQRLYDYVVADEQDDATQGDGYHSSMSYVLEMVWHYLFGEEPFVDYSRDPGNKYQLVSTSLLGQPLNLYL